MNNTRILLLAGWLVAPAVLFFVGRSLREKDPSANLSREEASSGTQRVRVQDGEVRDELYGRLRGLKNSDEFESFFLGGFSDENQHMEKDPARHDELIAIADAWGNKSPEEAVKFLNQLAIPDVWNPYLFFALGQWSRQDPEAALQWLKANYPDEMNESGLYLTAGLIRGMVHSEPEKAFDILLAMNPGPEQRGAVDFLLQTWAQQGSKSLSEYLDRIPEKNERLREAALRKAIQYLPTEEFATMNEWASQLPNLEDRLTTQTSIAAHWAQRDGPAAMDWAGNLPDDDYGIRSEAMARAVTYWGREDPDKAFEWASEHHGDPNYDRARRSLAFSTVGYQHEKAFEEIAQITDPAEREQRL